MKLVDRLFAELTIKQPRRSTHRSVADLTSAVERWVADWNDNPAPSSGIRPLTRSLTTLLNSNLNPDSGHLIPFLTRLHDKDSS